MAYLKELAGAFVRSRLLRVALIGAVGVVVQTAVFEVLGIWLMLVRPSTAVVAGGEVAILVNFFLNNRFSFGDRADGAFVSRLLRFHAVVMGSLLIQWLFVFAAEQWTQSVLLLHAAYGAGILVGFAFNYTGYHWWVWRPRDSQKEKTSPR